MAWRLVLLLTLAACVFGLEPCGPLNGTWRNQLGSQVSFLQSPTGGLVGRYKTAVETRPGAAGSGNVLYGIQEPSTGILTFSVNWKGRTSTTTWVGQCMRCGGREVIQTTWILRRRGPSCRNIWNTTMTNQDVFHRINSRQPNITLPQQEVLESESRRTSEQDNCQLHGTWFNDQGATMMLELEGVSHIQGTISESLTSQAGGSTPVTGQWDSSDPGSTFGLHTVSSGTPQGLAVIGWAGQCYRCNGGQLLDTMWLMKTPAQSCLSNWATFHVGRHVFTTTAPDNVPEE